MNQPKTQRTNKKPNETPNKTSPQNNPPIKYPKDPREYRATFGVSYPQKTIILTSTNDCESQSTLKDKDDTMRRIQSVRVNFDMKFKTIKNYIFFECNFKHLKGKAYANITNLTFKN